MSLEMTASLKSALGELYYREGCDQKGWAYVPVKEINPKDNIIVFYKGARRISVRLMDRLVPEVTETTAFDYLACRVGQKYEDVMLASPDALCWVKIGKTFSSDQIDTLGRIKIPLAAFRIRDLLAPPAKVEIKWDIRPGEEWLDELDELRDQAEYDDEYF